jgi:hypothetical protein
MGRSGGFGSYFFLQISLGIYFGIMGINGLTSYSSRGGSNDILSLTTAIILLVAGIFLAVNLFAPVGGRLAPLLYIAVMIIWTIIIVTSLILNNNFLRGGVLVWLTELSWRVALLAGTWIVSRREF